MDLRNQQVSGSNPLVGSNFFTLDPVREIVQRAKYSGPGGGELKRYVLLEAVEIDGTHFPSEVRLEHAVNGFDNLIHYEYWPQREGIPAEQFSQDITQETFLSRLRNLIHERGQGERLEAEIELANSRIRTYGERLGKLKAEARGD